MFDRIAALPAYRIVYEAIEGRILAGALGAGDQLPTETDLANQFGLARHTVREGLRLLEESGLVSRQGGRRLFVREPHYSELAPRMSRALVMQRVTIGELWEASMSFEPSAAMRAAGRISGTELAALGDNLQEMEVVHRAGKSIIDLDIKFHTIIAEAAGNRALLLAREPISQLFYPALDRLFSHPQNVDVGPRRLIEAHHRILQALTAADPGEAEAWMRRHIKDFHRGCSLCGFDLGEAVGYEARSASRKPFTSAG